jgi:hypothetical protein
MTMAASTGSCTLPQVHIFIVNIASYLLLGLNFPLSTMFSYLNLYQLHAFPVHNARLRDCVCPEVRILHLRDYSTHFHEIMYLRFTSKFPEIIQFRFVLVNQIFSHRTYVNILSSLRNSSSHKYVAQKIPITTHTHIHNFDQQHFSTWRGSFSDKKKLTHVVRKY